MAYVTRGTYLNAEEEVKKSTEPPALLTKDFFKSRIESLEETLSINQEPIVRSSIRTNLEIYKAIWGEYNGP
jgi:hypothetical protein